MFKDEDPLPGSEIEPAIGNGQNFRGPGDRSLQVGRHVVGSFRSVGVIGIVFWCQPLEPFHQIPARRWICIFSDDETGTGVAQKQLAKPCLDVCPVHTIRQRLGDFVKTLPGGLEG